jgi:predicted PurR-regulated permease PerM
LGHHHCSCNPSHFYNRLKSALGGRGRLAATLITIFALILLLVPTIMLSYSLIDSVQDFSAQLEDGTLKVPPPSDSVRSWPFIGEPVYKMLWSLGSQDLGGALNKMVPILKKYVMVLPSTAAHAGVGILIFLVSIIIAGVLLAHDDGAQQSMLTLLRRLYSIGRDRFLGRLQALFNMAQRGNRAGTGTRQS